MSDRIAHAQWQLVMAISHANQCRMLAEATITQHCATYRCSHNAQGPLARPLRYCIVEKAELNSQRLMNAGFAG